MVSTERHGTPFQVFLHTLRAFVLLHKFTVAAAVNTWLTTDTRIEKKPYMKLEKKNYNVCGECSLRARLSARCYIHL